MERICTCYSIAVSLCVIYVQGVRYRGWNFGNVESYVCINRNDLRNFLLLEEKNYYEISKSRGIINKWNLNKTGRQKLRISISIHEFDLPSFSLPRFRYKSESTKISLCTLLFSVQSERVSTEHFQWPFY